MSDTWRDRQQQTSEDEIDYAEVPHTYVRDINFTLDTSGEACVTCGLDSRATIHKVQLRSDFKVRDSFRRSRRG